MSREVWKTRLLIVACAVVVLQALFMTGFAQAVGRAASVAKPSPTCTYAAIAGAWALTVTGTAFMPDGTAVPVGNIARPLLKADGSFTATETMNGGGIVSDETLNGTWTVNPDCRGTFTVNHLDKSGNVASTAYFDAIYDNNQTEFRGVITPLVKGTSAQAVLTMSGTKLFPGAEDQQ